MYKTKRVCNPESNGHRVHPPKQSSSPRVRLRDAGCIAELNHGSDMAVHVPKLGSAQSSIKNFSSTNIICNFIVVKIK